MPLGNYRRHVVFTIQTAIRRLPTISQLPFGAIMIRWTSAGALLTAISLLGCGPNVSTAAGDAPASLALSSAGSVHSIKKSAGGQVEIDISPDAIWTASSEERFTSPNFPKAGAAPDLVVERSSARLALQRDGKSATFDSGSVVLERAGVGTIEIAP